MLKRIALVTAAAGFLAAGALPTAASAEGYGYFQFGGPGWNFGFFDPPPPRPVCRPIVKNVKWWDNWGYPHWNQVVVGQDCGYRYGYGYGAYHKRPHNWQGGGQWGGPPQGYVQPDGVPGGTAY